MTSTLHTDKLEAQFGPTHIEIIRHNDAERVVNIVDGQGICRTHAITWFTESNKHDDPEFNAAAEEIKNGGSLGKIFREHGYAIEKKPLTHGNVLIPDWLKGLFQMDKETANFRIYEFIAVGGDKISHPYGVVCEIDSPAFRTNTDNGADGDSTETDASGSGNKYLERMKRYLETNPIV